MIAQEVGQRLSHQKKTFLIFSGELARELLKKVIRTRTILRAGPDLVRTRTISIVTQGKRRNPHNARPTRVG